jgi:cobalt/nickel transport system permease protein
LHIPDGFLDPTWIIATYAATLGYLAATWRKAGELIKGDRAVTVSVFAAGIFVAQMLNWPLPGGTSLHFVGGALAGIVFGPVVGFYVMIIVLAVQTLVFHDGGLTTFGANVLNMAIIDVLAGYYAYRLVVRLAGNSRRSRFLGAFLGGWLGIVLAGFAAGVEIGLSPSFPYGVTVSVPVMVSWHALLGVIEGLATAFIVDYLYSKGGLAAWGGRL